MSPLWPELTHCQHSGCLGGVVGDWQGSRRRERSAPTEMPNFRGSIGNRILEDLLQPYGRVCARERRSSFFTPARVRTPEPHTSSSRRHYGSISPAVGAH
jgi:hypothetical protein